MELASDRLTMDIEKIRQEYLEHRQQGESQ
jgi:hypothetical protein